MRFRRTRIPTQSTQVLRAISARTGWLVESPDVLRCGFGGAVDEFTLTSSADGRTANALFAEHELTGDDGPVGSGIVAFASLPFDREEPGQLVIPRFTLTQDRAGAAWLSERVGSPPWSPLLDEVSLPTQDLQSIRSVSYQPTPEEYAHQVALAVEILRRKELEKVVLARAVAGTVPEPIDPAAIAQRLRTREPYCTIYSLPLPDGRRFVGASPELLARRRGASIQLHPLAGTIALPANVAPDDYENWLLGSTKNLHEHELLVDDLVGRLRGDYEDLVADPSPSIVALRTVAHLGTWINGVHHGSDAAPDALAILRLLHPTAAVGGIPREPATALIARLEAHARGHYAGPVGWLDAEGDGEWWIGIRGVMVGATNFEAWAGAGIVSESDPIAEREETRDKLASVLSSVLADRV